MKQYEIPSIAIVAFEPSPIAADTNYGDANVNAGDLINPSAATTA